MDLITTRAEWRDLLEARRRQGETIGLVPTMGALHDGHLSLVRAAREREDTVAMTIFVNPLQFGDPRDLTAYPRDLDADLGLAQATGVAAVFAPSVEEMYPDGPSRTTVQPGPFAERLEGASRPGHFAGVATVVTKLFALAGQCRAYFGEKDYQQLAVVRSLATDLDLPVEVVGCPIIREADGLAMSSRNRRLSPEDRTAALALSRALAAGAAAVCGGGQTIGTVESAMRAVLDAEPSVETDYAAAVDPATLEAPATLEGEVRLLVAAQVGPVRLIDNCAARAGDLVASAPTTSPIGSAATPGPSLA